MALYRDAGVVLRTYKLGEADRIVVLCTRGHGKVRAVAKGVRKTGSTFGSRLEPGSHVNLQLYEGRDLHIVRQAEYVEIHPEVRSDLDRLGRVSQVLEAIDHVAQEGESVPMLYDMTVAAVRAIAAYDSPLVVPAFFLRLLEAEGVGMGVSACVECGSEDDLVSLDIASGGLCCAAHRRGVAITPEAVLILQLILGGRVSTALGLPVGAASFEVDHLAGLAFETHVERRLRSLRVLHEP